MGSEFSGNVWRKRSRFDASISRFCHRYRVAKSSTPLRSAQDDTVIRASGKEKKGHVFRQSFYFSFPVRGGRTQFAPTGKGGTFCNRGFIFPPASNGKRKIKTLYPKASPTESLSLWERWHAERDGEGLIKKK